MSDEEQAAGALLAVVAERTPELETHVNGVADLAAAVAHRLGMSDGETAQVRRAAELHDI